MEQTSHKPLVGRVAFVTGAAGGMGVHITRALLERGATVAALDVDSVGLASLASALASESLGERMVTRTLDISDATACAGAVDDTIERFGSLDILVNNAAVGMGVVRADHMTNPVAIEELTPEIWDRFVAVNLSGAWYLSRAVAPAMKRVGWGRIINVTTTFYTMLRSRFHPYGPLKAAVEAMSAGHAAEFAGSGVTVNVLIPGGTTDTPMVTDVEAFDRRDLIPPTALVRPLLWLCSPEADAVTGRRFVGALWADGEQVSSARAASESPIGWPLLAENTIWPGATRP